MRHFKGFHVFHIAAESASYSEAAQKLHITHGAVSKQIKQLEAYLAQPLFYKKGRGVQLTREGELLKQYTGIAFDALDTGIQKLQSAHSNHLDVSCEPTLSMRWLMPRLSAFYHQSAIDIRLSTAGGAIALPEAGLSMAIRRNDFAIPAHYERCKLVDEWVGPVVCAKYWRERAGDLQHISLLHSETRPQAWNDWSIAANHPLSLSKSNHQFQHFYFCLQAAADGLGAAIGSYPLVADDINNGRLIAPLGFIPSGHCYVLLRKPQEISLKEKAFQQWLKSAMSQCVPDESKKWPLLQHQ